MDKKARDGNPISRAPWGYKYEDKKLIQGDHSYQVQEVFQDFLKSTFHSFSFSIVSIKSRKLLENLSSL